MIAATPMTIPSMVRKDRARFCSSPVYAVFRLCLSFIVLFHEHSSSCVSAGYNLCIAFDQTIFDADDTSRVFGSVGFVSDKYYCVPVFLVEVLESLHHSTTRL